MLSIRGSDIYIPKGDSGKLVIELVDKDAGLRILLEEEGTEVFFTVKNSVASSDPCLEKRISNFEAGKAEINISPADTSRMKVRDYVYDIRIKWNTGLVDTLVKGKFVVEGSVADVI